MRKILYILIIFIIIGIQHSVIAKENIKYINNVDITSFNIKKYFNIYERNVNVDFVDDKSILLMNNTNNALSLLYFKKPLTSPFGIEIKFDFLISGTGEGIYLIVGNYTKIVNNIDRATSEGIPLIFYENNSKLYKIESFVHMIDVYKNDYDYDAPQIKNIPVTNPNDGFTYSASNIKNYLSGCHIIATTISDVRNKNADFYGKIDYSKGLYNYKFISNVGAVETSGNLELKSIDATIIDDIDKFLFGFGASSGTVTAQIIVSNITIFIYRATTTL